MTKTCKTCFVEKPLSEFHRRAASSDGFNIHCKPCAISIQVRRSSTEKYRQKRAEWRARNRERLAARRQGKYRYEWGAMLRWKFGITPEDYEAMLAEQGGVCAICGEPETARHGGKVKRLAIDHCHETGRIRGLLCLRCNTALAKFEKNPALLYRVLEYLGVAHV